MTVADAVLAFPVAYYMARVASRGARATLFVLVLLPLWSSYLLRVYAWRLILDHDGLLNWSLQKVGLPAANIAYSNVAIIVVFSYIWLPFMIIPVYAALERIPRSTLEASATSGPEGPHVPLRHPAARPARLVAGLDLHLRPDLGDCGPRRSSAGPVAVHRNVVYASVGVSNNVRPPRPTRQCRSPSWRATC